jgi:hypothetical protein
VFDEMPKKSPPLFRLLDLTAFVEVLCVSYRQ